MPAFKVDSLAHLRQLYARALEQQVKVLSSFDHGVTLSFYFMDP
jgi:catechol-2,3-dioxygenase